MKKQELIHLHGLLIGVNSYLSEKDLEYNPDLKAYKQIGVRPTSIHQSKAGHRDAVFTLLDTIVGELGGERGSGESAGETRSRHRTTDGRYDAEMEGSTRGYDLRSTFPSGHRAMSYYEILASYAVEEGVAVTEGDREYLRFDIDPSMLEEIPGFRLDFFREDGFIAVERHGDRMTYEGDVIYLPRDVAVEAAGAVDDMVNGL